jgi:hypothetical protein
MAANIADGSPLLYFSFSHADTGAAIFHRSASNKACPKQRIEKSKMKGADGMNPAAPKAAKTPQEPYRFKKRLGSTTFIVTARFSETSRETAGDKIARLIRWETSSERGFSVGDASDDAVHGKAANE